MLGIEIGYRMLDSSMKGIIAVIMEKSCRVCKRL